jgi:NTP pyrophosphatase (non-canonical NTP hydrolase)
VTTGCREVFAVSDEKTREFWDTLKVQRDELRVQMHLARAELKDEWDEVEKKWDDAQEKLDDVVTDASVAAKEAQHVLKVVGEEISDTYERIKSRLKEEKQ